MFQLPIFLKYKTLPTLLPAGFMFSSSFHIYFFFGSYIFAIVVKIIHFQVKCFVSTCGPDVEEPNDSFYFEVYC